MYFGVATTFRVLEIIISNTLTSVETRITKVLNYDIYCINAYMRQ